jgi:CHAT domain-containing protein
LLRKLPRTCGLLEYTLLDDGVVAVAVGPDRRMAVAILPLQPQQLVADVRRLRDLLAQQSDDVYNELHRWHEQLVAPFATVLAGAQQVLVAADGALHLVPFAALLDGERFLAEQYAVATAPSLTVALSSRPAGTRTRAAGSALVVAAPDLSNGLAPSQPELVALQDDARLSGQLLAMAYQPLPGAQAEGEAVAAGVPGAVLLSGPAATKERLLAEGGRYRVLHVATHGYADPEVPEYSGLLLGGADGGAVLTAQEVYLWALGADLVTLSACETGLGRSAEGEGLLGLTRAFLYAGARDVLCSLWQIGDRSTATLMVRFYSSYRATADPARALQAAQRALLGDEATRHPYHWAAFVVVQGPR